MDLIGELPDSKGYNATLVVVAVAGVCLPMLGDMAFLTPSYIHQWKLLCLSLTVVPCGVWGQSVLSLQLVLL